MSKLFVALTMVLGMSANVASALTLYPCTVTYRSADLPDGLTHQIFVLKNLPNQDSYLMMGHTLNIAFSINDQNQLIASINGQTAAPLAGSLALSTFKTKSETGTVACSAPIETDYLLGFKPWSQFYSLDGNVKPASTVTESQVSDLSCYVGDLQAARSAIATRMNTAVSVNGTSLSFQFTDQECLHGTGEYDGFTCDDYETVTKTEVIALCGSFADSTPETFTPPERDY